MQMPTRLDRCRRGQERLSQHLPAVEPIEHGRGRPGRKAIGAHGVDAQDIAQTVERPVTQRARLRNG